MAEPTMRMESSEGLAMAPTLAALVRAVAESGLAAAHARMGGNRVAAPEMLAAAAAAAA